jgi:hypothetical protein
LLETLSIHESKTMNDLLLAWLMLPVAVIQLICVAYAARNMGLSKRSKTPHPSLVASLSCAGLIAFIQVLRFVDLPRETNSSNVILVASVIGVVAVLAGITHVYWRMWAAMQARADS